MRDVLMHIAIGAPVGLFVGWVLINWVTGCGEPHGSCVLVPAL